MSDRSKRFVTEDCLGFDENGKLIHGTPPKLVIFYDEFGNSHKEPYEPGKIYRTVPPRPLPDLTPQA